MKYSSNKKYNALCVAIEENLNYLGISEIKRYKKDFPYEPDYNIAQYGNLLCYYYDVRKLFEDCGYKADNYSDDKLWNGYMRTVGYVAREMIGC